MQFCLYKYNMVTEKRKWIQWWIVFAILLSIIIVLWIIVIFYLLSPSADTLLNKQILLRDKHGTDHLVLLWNYQVKIHASSKKPKPRSFVKKQQYVKMYDLQKRRWLEKDFLSLIPSFRGKNLFYFLDYCPVKKHFTQIEFDRENKLQTTPWTYPANAYFFKELATLFGIQGPGSSHHQLIGI